MLSGHEVFDRKTDGRGYQRPLPVLLPDYQVRARTKPLVVFQKGLLDQRVRQTSAEKRRQNRRAQYPLTNYYACDFLVPKEKKNEKK